MKALGGNYAFVDSQNVNLGIQALVWRLDFQKFRVYLAEKYGVEKTHLFLGYIAKYDGLYQKLRSFGYELLFKPTVVAPDGSLKGNCDAELVLQAMIDLENYRRAVIVTGDGDFACLVRYLDTKDKLERLLIPNRHRYSRLLDCARSRLASMNNLRDQLCLP